MKCEIDLNTYPITLKVLPQYLTKDELETIKRVGHRGTITLLTLDGAMDEIEKE